MEETSQVPADRNWSNRTEVYDSYWIFAAERHAIYERRLLDAYGPWTKDPILRTYRFTNTFRAADRVSQYLIRNVQNADGRSQNAEDIFLRTLLFKIFNRIETWELIEERTGPLLCRTFNPERIGALLEEASRNGQRIYSAAYIMPPPALGHARKHINHLALLLKMLKDRLPQKIHRAKSLEQVYELILEYPGIGPFLAFQYTIDLNYSSLLNFNESDFVVAGPGALDGISKCFGAQACNEPERVIYNMTERQEYEFSRLGITFRGLFGRPMQPIDCQNVFCEISKYSRVSHPEIRGRSGRVRIKQIYRAEKVIQPPPIFPSRWGLKVPVIESLGHPPRLEHQHDLFDWQ
jgi:hypothetical protein